MKYLKNYKLWESLQEDKILMIVDVQEDFQKYIPQGMVEAITEYCKGFDSVYQIWDSHKAQEPDYKFPNQKGNLVKKFGTKFSADLEKICKDLNKKYPNAKEGEYFKFNDTDSYVVKITNNHSWFYVTEQISKSFKSLKGKNVTLIGGAGPTNSQFYSSKNGDLSFDNGECIKDVYESMIAFGIKVQYDTRYIYNSKTSNNQIFNKSIQNLML